MRTRKLLFAWWLAACVVTAAGNLYAQGGPAPSAEELAKKLSNPIASLISVPIQSNMDVGLGSFNGSKLVVNVQPVIPFKLSESLNLITRWIVPVVSQFDLTGDHTDQAGLGDAVLSAFFSPSNSALTWGLGPVFLVPTATDDVLGAKKFGVGPTVVALKQVGPWTYGGLANQIWSVAGDKDRGDVSATFLNPFVAHNWKSGAGVTVTAEYTRDWENEINTLVCIAVVSAVTKFGSQTASVAVGPRVHLAPDNHASYGIRSVLTLVFPK